jgi:hypothetical protein
MCATVAGTKVAAVSATYYNTLMETTNCRRDSCASRLLINFLIGGLRNKMDPIFMMPSMALACCSTFSSSHSFRVRFTCLLTSSWSNIFSRTNPWSRWSRACFFASSSSSSSLELLLLLLKRESRCAVNSACGKKVKEGMNGLEGSSSESSGIVLYQ